MLGIIVINIDETLKDLGAYLYYAIVRGIKPSCAGREGLEEFITEVEGYVRGTYVPLESLKDIDKIKAYRSFLWRLRIDPTKTRPSSEALVRRILRGQNLPRVNDVVDIGNAVSAYTLIPIGLYDVDKLRPPLLLTLSRGGEVFDGIGGKREILKRNVPILIDSENKVLHVYPHRDSLISAVTSKTKSLLVVGAGVRNVPEAEVMRSTLMVIEYLLKFKCAEKYEGPWRAR